MEQSWDDGLLVGVAQIDQQHRELFGRMDALMAAIRAGSSQQEVERVLGFLSEYVVSHFSLEEALMERSGFPNREVHREEHAAFVRDLGALEVEHRREGATPKMAARVNARVIQWMRDHILRTDRRLAKHLGGQRSTWVRRA